MTGVASRSAERGHERNTRMVAEPTARIANASLDCHFILRCVALGADSDEIGQVFRFVSDTGYD